MADVTVTDFREMFPEFSSASDTVVGLAIEEAYSLTDVIRAATLYAAAHVLRLNLDTAAGDETLGEVEEVKVGPITLKHKTSQASSGDRGSGVSSRQEFFTRTVYGRRVLALESRNAGAMMSVRIG